MATMKKLWAVIAPICAIMCTAGTALDLWNHRFWFAVLTAMGAVIGAWDWQQAQCRRR